MRQFRVWLSVLVIGGGLILMAVRPREAATVAPWIGAAVGYWFGGRGSDGDRDRPREAAAGGGGAGAGGRGETGEG